MFLASPHDTVRQGDIYVVPTLRVCGPEGREPGTGRPAMGASSVHEVWGPEDPHVEVRRGLAVVLSHDCEIEKEFNREVERLKQDGTAEEEAVRRAEADPTLDRWVVIAPLRAYEEFPEEEWPGIRQGQRIGYMPLDRLPGVETEMVIDLGEATTVERHLLLPRGKIASLDAASVGDLRFKVTECYAVRGLSALSEIEALTGRTIVRTEVTEKSKKKSSLALWLDDGSTAHLEVRRPRDQLPEEVTRSSD